MELGTIIIIVILVAIFAIFLKLFKKIMKALAFTILIFAVFNLVFGYLLYKDIEDLKENFGTAPKLFVYDNNGSITAGAIIKNESEVTFITQEEQEEYTKLYGENNLEEIRGDNYKLLIIKEGFIQEELDIEDGPTLTKKEVIEIITSENSIETFQSIVGEEFVFEDDAELRDQVFMMSVGSALDEGGSIYLIQQYKEDNVIIYKKTPAFIVMKFAPNFLLKTMGKVA